MLSSASLLVLWTLFLGQGVTLGIAGNVWQLGRMVVEGDLAYGLVLVPFLTLDPLTWALFLVFTVTGGLLFVGFLALVQSLAFWLGSVEGLAGAATEFLLSFTLYPEPVFPPPMRWVFYSILPAGFLAFLPLKVLRDLDWGSGCR